MRLSPSLFIYPVLCAGLSAALASQEKGHISKPPAIFSPDFAETPPAGNPLGAATGASTPKVSGPIAAATSQPAGALSGRIVFTSGGHGWTWGSSGWYTQRGVVEEMNEDYGNMDQMTLFAYYCFNAGATVVPLRPVGHQTNEVVLDNDDPGVTFSGTWNNSSQTTFFGSAGDVPYRFAHLSNSETATATYTPNIPVTGFYPVYGWALAGSDRGDQLYRIRHTGGESQVRVPHYMVGSGWIYLGTYYFNAGSNLASGAAIVSNLRGTATGTVVIADAIRFGNGMGDIDRGTGVSTYPREEECSRYWLQKALGQGQSPTLYDPDYPSVTTDDDSDNVGAPPRMAKEMNREASGNMFKRIFLGFHSNAGGGKGCVGLYNDETLFPNTATPNQKRWAEIAATNQNNAMYSLTVPPLEVLWENDRSELFYARSDYAFGEINDASIGGEFDATIIEVAFHDDPNNAKILRDPKGRNWIARACCQSVVRYMNEFDGGPLNFLPEPPANVRAIAVSNGVTISWSTPTAMFSTGTPTNYLVYRSTDGYGFGNPASVGGTGTNLTLTDISADTNFYFRVAAVNAGGESMPSETVGCRRSTNSNTKALVVNAFDRYTRDLNLRQTPSAQNYKIPGHNANSGTMERVLPRSNNSFDYVVTFGASLDNYGLAFDSCQNEAVSSGQVNLTNYSVVIWNAGNESTADETFSSAEQTKISNHLLNGGGLFASGGEIGWDLDRTSGPTTADRNFFHTNLHAAYTNDDSGVYTVTNVAGSIFNGLPNATFDDGSKGIYMVGYPDVIGAFGSGSTKALNYVGVSSGAAAIQYDGSAGGGKVVCFGFPFETITSAAVRSQYMTAILTFLVPSAPSIATQPSNQTVVHGANATFNVIANGAAPLSYQWRFNGANISNATTNSYTKTNAQPADAGSYTVVVTNSSGSVTSAVATLTVNVPPGISAQPQSLTVTQGNNAVFSVTATGTPSPGYQWRFNGANISSATSSSYTRSSAQPADAESYTVVATNVAGSITSSVATLTVLVPPSITAQPTDKTVALGSNGTFFVTASGTAPLGYQWRFNGADISGATTNSYTRPNAGTNDAGSYSVVITNIAGGITSSVATLTVVIPPSITTQPQNQLVWVGSNFTFSVSATGDAPLNYQWRFNGTNLPGGTTTSRARANAQTNDSGNYSVTVSNAAAVATSSDARLTVVDAPPKFQLITPLPGNQYKLIIAGVPGSYLLESSGDLNGGWSSLTNLSNTNGTLEFTDSPSATLTQRYYRALIVP